MKIVFVTGGVCSSLGKGIIASSIGCVLSENNKIIIRKMDPYLNIDPGTMSPLEHGEVFVTRDGGEADLDLGHYERFAKVITKKSDSITSGKIYWDVLNNERRGKYLGKTIQVIPHITDAIKEKMLTGDEDSIIICELGGTVGDIEGGPFLEAARQIKLEFGSENCMFVHVGLMPKLSSSGEIKTKPIQSSVQTLMSKGIIPDLLFCRSPESIDEKARKKISMFCNVSADDIIDAPDVDDIYKLPHMYSLSGMCGALERHLKVKTSINRAKKMYNMANAKKNFTQSIKLGIVGKYFDNNDSYRSLLDSIYHASLNLSVVVEQDFIDCKSPSNIDLSKYDCCIVPGGFGAMGVDAKLEAIGQAREKKIPFLGICYGMQLSVIEFAKNVVGIKNASSEEFGDKKNDTMLVRFAKEWHSVHGKEARKHDSKMGGTMRLGSYEAVIKPNTLLDEIYDQNAIFERHRHRYEVVSTFVPELEKAGLSFSAFSKDGALPECIEIRGDKKDQFFVGCQFHPEFETDIFEPHPLFVSLIKAAIDSKKNNKQ